jgi:GNAT superfamily N-acetyltransferase
MGALDFGGIVYTTGEAGRTVVGTFSRAIDIGSDGEYAVYSEGLTIEKEYRGRGFGTKFSKFSEDLYRSMGISKIYLTAGEEDGSYVWAKAGYDWADTPTRVVFQIKKLIDDVKNKDDLEFEPGEKSKILDALADYRDRFNDLELSDKGYPTPIEIANTMIGNYNLGRKILGNNVRWRGVKVL